MKTATLYAWTFLSCNRNIEKYLRSNYYYLFLEEKILLLLFFNKIFTQVKEIKLIKFADFIQSFTHFSNLYLSAVERIEHSGIR